MSERRGPRQRFFDLWSRSYDAPWLQRFTYRPEQDAVLRRLTSLEPGARVLDVGCGTGQLAARLRRRLPELDIVACDYSAGMLEKARARAGELRWVRADAQRLPFAAERFDALVSTEAFHWFPDPQAALRGFHRVLAPGGWLLIALVNPPLGMLSELTATGSKLLGQPLYWPTPRRMRGWLGEAGFEVIEQRPILRLPLTLLFPTVLSVARRPV